jgi:hypothetical protein
MFDLNKAIAGWRQEMSAQQTIRDTDLDELEDHLRSEIEGLTGSGLSAEEAFQVARMRLGKPGDVAGEFAIADPDSRRSFRMRWMVVGALALLALYLGSGMLVGLGASLIGLAQSRGVFPEQIAGLGWGISFMQLLILVVGCLFIWRLLRTDSSSRHLSNLSLGKIVVMGLVLGFLALVARGMPGFFMVRTMTEPAFLNIAVAGAWFRMGILLILPVFLLVILWRLVRN